MRAGWGGRPGEAGRASPRRIAGTALLQLAARAGNVALGVATVAVLARALGPADFGVWSTALAFVSIFAFLTDFGFVQVAIQHMASDPDREKAWLGALTAARAGGSLVALVVCLAGIPLLSPEADVRAVTLVLSLTILGAAPSALVAVFESRLRGGIAMGLLSVQSVTWLVAVGLVTLSDGSVLAYAWAFNATALLAGLLQVLATQRFAHIALREGIKLLRPLIRVGVPVGLGGVLVTIYYRIDAVLLFNLRGPVEAGVYGAAYRFLDPLHFFPSSVMLAVFPVVASAYASDPERAKRLIQAGADYLAVVSLPVLGGSLALAEPLVEALLGPGYERTAGLLPILMLAFVFVSLGYLGGYLVPLVGLQWRFALYAGLGAVANVVLNLLLIPDFGAYGAAWATVATELAVNALVLLAVARALRFRPSPGRMARAAVAATLMTVAVTLAAPAGLVAGLLVAAPVYLGALLLLRVIRPGEIRELRGGRPPR